MDIEELKQSWQELQEQTRKQKIVTTELIRSAITDRVEHLGQGFRLAAILLTVGFLLLLTCTIPRIYLIISHFGGGLFDNAVYSAAVGCGLLLAEYLLAGFTVAAFYRAHRRIVCAGDLRRMSQALKRYKHMSRNLKPAIIINVIIITWMSVYVLTDADTAAGIVITAGPIAAAIYFVKNRRDARDIKEIERKIADLERLDE